jgi:hypothetical protein
MTALEEFCLRTRRCVWPHRNGRSSQKTRLLIQTALAGATCPLILGTTIHHHLAAIIATRRGGSHNSDATFQNVTFPSFVSGTQSRCYRRAAFCLGLPSEPHLETLQRRSLLGRRFNAGLTAAQPCRALRKGVRIYQRILSPAV